MMTAASRALADMSPVVQGSGAALLPPLGKIREVSKIIALAVFKQAIEDEVAMPIPDDMIMEKIEAEFWHPEYREYRRTSF
jgi:malate dehydrogenase (oxaloacetate-decarboxylating)